MACYEQIGSELNLWFIKMSNNKLAYGTMGKYPICIHTKTQV